jgi:glycosyltransferase involved in cell wall biosynthesis
MKKLLSICIPTFNRASQLEVTLQSIAIQLERDPSLLECVEIIISDNLSSDSTPTICLLFVKRFPNNFIYYRNAINIQDYNPGYVIERANGHYQKLHNDSHPLRGGSLAWMVSYLNVYRNDRTPIVFSNFQHTNDLETLCNTNDVVNRLSYWVTWISCFGLWREGEWNLESFNMYALSKLPQTRFLLRIIAKSQRVVLVHGVYCDGLNVGRKSGYNVAKIFGSNYFSILKELVAEGVISDRTYDFETKRTLSEYIIPWYFSDAHDFDKSGFFKYLIDYVDKGYLYAEVEKYIISLTSANKK